MLSGIKISPAYKRCSITTRNNAFSRNQNPYQKYASSRVFRYFLRSARRDEEGVVGDYSEEKQRSGAEKIAKTRRDTANFARRYVASDSEYHRIHLRPRSLRQTKLARIAAEDIFDMGSRWIIAGALVLATLGAGMFVLFSERHQAPAPVPVKQVEPQSSGPKHAVIGVSVENRAIDAYMYGGGKTQILFVGGMHGGYEWNSILLTYAFMDYLDAHPEIIPAGLTIAVVPSVNPDGVYKVIGKEGRFTVDDVPKNISLAPGRFNAHEVDLNRNFDCNWQPTGMWQGKTVSAGSKPFSEPESAAIRDFVLQIHPSAAIFWHSQANAVYASACKTGILPETQDIMNAYAHASKYPAVKSFDSYQVTGDSEGWLASIGIPAITVELQTHDTIEWERNLSGIKALFDYENQSQK